MIRRWHNPETVVSAKGRYDSPKRVLTAWDDPQYRDDNTVSGAA